MNKVSSRTAWHCEPEGSLHRDIEVISYERTIDRTNRVNPKYRYWLVRHCRHCEYVWWEEDVRNVVTDGAA